MSADSYPTQFPLTVEANAPSCRQNLYNEHLRYSMSIWRLSRPAHRRAATLVASFLTVVVCAIPAFTQSSSQESQLQQSSSNQPKAAAAPPARADAKKAKEAYREAVRAEHDQDWQAAYTAYSDAVTWAPNDRQYFLLREVAKSRLVQFRMDAAERDAVAGRFDDARRELLAATYLDPKNSMVRERLMELADLEPGQVRSKQEHEIAGEARLSYEPGQHTFDYRGDTQGAYQAVAQQFGVEVAFDVDMRSRPVRFHFDNVDFPTATRLLGDMTGTFWRAVSPRLFFVTDDTVQKRREYEPSLVRTVLLPASETPDQMTEILRLVRDMAGITRSELDTRSRTLTLRASPRDLSVATDLIDQLEKPVGQLVLEMEVLEVDRNYARQLGIIPPQSSQLFSLNSQEIQEAEQGGQSLIGVIDQIFGLPSSLSGLSPTQIATLISSGQLNVNSLLPPVVAFGGGMTTFLATLPGATANFSQMLSLVQHGQRILLRAEDGQPATFFVGDRVPVSLANYSASFAGTGAGTPGVSSTNFPTTNYPVGNSPSFVATASLRDNGINDLIVANSADNTISVLLGNGDGTFATQSVIPVGTDPVSIATANFNPDVNDDTNLDIAVANQGSNTVSILLGKGDGTFTAGTPVTTGNAPVSVVTADFHDSTAGSAIDLAVANQNDSTISIFTGNGDGTFKTPATLITLSPGSKPSAIDAVDVNADGHLDLVIANEGTNSISIFLGNGDGTFTQASGSPYAVGNSPTAIVSADFNSDGIPDLAVANSGAPFTASNGTEVTGNSVSILLGLADTNGGASGTFGQQTAFAAGNAPTSLAVGDYNVDGLPDLAAAAKTDNAVSVLLNEGSGLFGPDFELPVGSEPVSIVSADFNGDGKTDVATANSASANASVILNSSSFAGESSAEPQTLFPGVQYIDLGLKIKATPRIHANNDVTLQLSFEVSSLTSQSFNTIPVIDSETVDQTVRVRENQTAMLAGFLQSQVTNAINGTPGVSELPGLDWLTANHNDQQQSQELLILVTPRMVHFAPREDRVIYAGQGGPEGAATGIGAPSAGAFERGVPPPTEQLPVQAPPQQNPPPGQNPPLERNPPPTQQENQQPDNQ